MQNDSTSRQVFTPDGRAKGIFWNCEEVFHSFSIKYSPAVIACMFFFIFLCSEASGAGFFTSISGTNFITGFEGCRLKTYKDAANINTIGYGNLSHAAPGKIITKDIAILYLHEDLRRFEKHVNNNFKRVPAQHEFDALVSFTYNVGYRFTGEMANLININLNEKAMEKLVSYCHIHKNGVLMTLKGLQRRRFAESKLFLKGKYK